MRIQLSSLAVMALILASCTAPSEPSPAETPQREGVVLLAATTGGVVTVDRSRNALVGLDRTGEQVWSDPDALDAGATFVCLVECPDAVLSYGYDPIGPDPEPVLIESGATSPFPVSAAHRRRVLTAVSATEAVVEESGAGNRTSLRLVRAGGEERIPVTHHDYLWAESPDRSSALALSRIPDAAGAEAYWFDRTDDGWRLVAAVPRGSAWHACVADGGAVAVVTGLEPALLLDRDRRVSLHTDLHAATECSIGQHGGTLVQRAVSTSGLLRTQIRGFDLSGTQTWARDYDSEAFVATDPSGRYTAVAHDGVLDLLDAGGGAIRTEEDVRSALFTETGELVTVSLAGHLRWLPPR
jgi:hypothetical protein